MMDHARNDTMDQLAQTGKPKEELGVGSVVPKASIESLEATIKDLQNLIRDPSVAGIIVPGLKAIQ